MRATVLFGLILLPAVIGGALEWKLDEFGLTEVKYNGHYVSNTSKSFFCFGYTLAHPNGTDEFIYQDQSTLNSPNRTLDSDGNGFSLLFTNWKYYCKYSSPENDAFLISCDITNLHPTAAMKRWSFALMRWMAPPPNVTITNYPTAGEGTAFDEVSYTMVSSTTGDFAFAVYPTSYRIPTVVTIAPNYDKHSLNARYSPRYKEDYIPAGATVNMQFKFKFGAVNDTYKKLGQEAYKAFRDQYPMTLNWPDRRPILTHFMASTIYSSPTNPRGYFNEPESDFVSEQGKANFKTRLLAAANTVVQQMQLANAQGMVLWDLEGNEFPHAITYIGDPVHAELLAPELVGAVDEYFKTITDAGFKCGLTIRPQQMEFGSEIPVGPCTNNSVYIHYTGEFKAKGYTCINDVYYISLPYFQPPGGDPKEIMINKMKYAKERWGCTIFYVDSNAPPGGWAYTSDVHEGVLEEVPDILVLPEQEFPRYYRSMAPYGEIDMNIWYVTVQAAETYPEAFGAVNVMDGTLYEDLLIESTLRGNVFIARGWFTDTRTQELYDILQKVEQDYPFDVNGDTEIDGTVDEEIEIAVDLTADRTSGITFDWRATGGSIQQKYNQYLTSVDVVYGSPGTYTVEVIVRRGITSKTHTVTVNVQAKSNFNGSGVVYASLALLLPALMISL